MLGAATPSGNTPALPPGAGLIGAWLLGCGRSLSSGSHLHVLPAPRFACSASLCRVEQRTRVPCSWGLGSLALGSVDVGGGVCSGSGLSAVPAPRIAMNTTLHGGTPYVRQVLSTPPFADPPRQGVGSGQPALAARPGGGWSASGQLWLARDIRAVRTYNGAQVEPGPSGGPRPGRAGPLAEPRPFGPGSRGSSARGVPGVWDVPAPPQYPAGMGELMAATLIRAALGMPMSSCAHWRRQ